MSASSSCDKKGKGYHVERMFSLTSETFPVTGYPILRRFLSEVRQADQTVLLFRKIK
jgi:hypothetical protein